MPAAIITGAQGQPGSVAYPSGIEMGIFNDLNHVIKDYIPQLVSKYGNSSYALAADILGNTVLETSDTNTFSHFEKGRLLGSALVNANVTSLTSGGNAVCVLKSPESYNDGLGGTQSPVLLEQIVKLRSNGKKARVTAITRTTDAFQVTLTPLGAYVLNSGSSGTTLSAGEGIEVVGNQLAGEASDSQGTMQSKLYRYDNTATVIRASVKASDLASMEKSQINMEGSNYMPHLAVKEMNLHMMHSIEDAVMEGVPYANTTDIGTVGVIPDVEDRGSEINYVTGTFTIGDFLNATNVLDSNGGPREYHGLQHLSQRQDINELLFGLYDDGAISYGSVGFSQEAAVSYGFKSFSTDTFDFHFHRYKGFSAQAKYGYTPTIGDYRNNFGLLVPQGSIQDAKDNTVRPQMQWVYRQHPDVPKGQKIYSWEVGFTKSSKTTVAENKYEQICYVGSRVIAAEQFLIMRGVAS